MKKFLAAFFEAVTWAVCGILMLFVFSGIWQHFSGSGYVGPLQIGYAVVVSGSMEPNIHIDDMIVYHEHPADAYKVGQVVVYIKDDERGRRLITHRIIEKGEDYYIIKGDANLIADEPVNFDQMVGRVVFRIPYVGKAAAYLKTPWGVGIVAVILLVLLLMNVFARSGDDEEEEDPEEGEPEVSEEPETANISLEKEEND